MIKYEVTISFSQILFYLLMYFFNLYFKAEIQGVPLMAWWLTNLTSIHEDAG